MNRLLAGVDIVAADLVHALLLEGDLAVDRIVGQFDDVVGGELGSFVLAVELHLVAVPRIPVGTDQIIPVVRVGIAEVKIDALNRVQMSHSHSDPRGQLLHLHFPSLDAPGY